MPAYKKTLKVPGKTSQELYDRVNKELAPFLDKLSLGQFKIECHADSKTFTLNGKGVEAKLFCREGELELDGSLSLFLLPFKSKIDEGIDRWSTKLFG